MPFQTAIPPVIPGSKKLKTLEVCTLKVNEELIIETPVIINPLITSDIISLVDSGPVNLFNNLTSGIVNFAQNADIIDMGPLQSTGILLESDTGNTISLEAPLGLTSDLNLIFPGNNGTTGQILTTDGSGNLSWSTGSGGSGSPAGSDTQIQYNDTGSFGASTGFTWDDSSNTLTLASGDTNSFITGAGSGSLTVNTSQIGSDLNIETSASTSAVNGGDVYITSGSSSGSGDSGSVIISAGLASGSGSNGDIRLLNIRSGVSSNALGILATGEIVESVSQRKYKKDETEIHLEKGFNIDSVLELEPKFFTWSSSGERDLGFIVEDVEKVDPNFVFYDSFGKSRNIKDRSIIAALVSKIKDLEKRLKNLEIL